MGFPLLKRGQVTIAVLHGPRPDAAQDVSGARGPVRGVRRRPDRGLGADRRPRRRLERGARVELRGHWERGGSAGAVQGQAAVDGSACRRLNPRGAPPCQSGRPGSSRAVHPAGRGDGVEWTLAIIAATLLGVAACSRLLTGTPVTAAMVLVAIGV